jgi:hypothetical protein
VAISKITGNILADNLERTTDIMISANSYVLFKVSATANCVVLGGNIRFQENTIRNGDPGKLEITGDGIDLGPVGNIAITGGTSGQYLQTDGLGGITWANVETSGSSLTLGTPSDGDLTDGAYDGWTSSTTLTDGIDDLNQVTLNVANSTYVGSADFSGNIVAGASPLTVAFNSSHIGNATQYLWDFGDGSTSTSENPSHTYSNVSGGQFTVSFTAYNSDGTYSGNIAAGAKGSADNETKTNYITLYTPNPIPSFTITDDTVDSASNVTLTNGSQYATNYQLDWGDGAGNVDPGNSWTTINNAYTNSGGDTQYTITLYGISTTAGPANVTVSTTDTVDVFSTHTTTFTSNTVRVINEESTSGGVVEFENTTATTPGTTATFGSGQKYRWTWGDGAVSNVNIQGGLTGNPSANITHTFALSSGQQSGGTTATFDVQLATLNGHTSSPFNSSNVTITVEPDVRANFSGTAVTVSDKSGDNQYDLYDGTDYNSNNRALARFTNTSQNADSYVYDWGDATANSNVTEDGASSGSIGATIDHDYSGQTAGSTNYTVDFIASGTPDTLAQTDSESLVFTLHDVPSAPAGLSSKSITVSTSAVGTSPLLAAGFTDNSGSNPLSAGDSLSTTTARRLTSGTVTTSTVQDVYDGITGTLTANVNGSADGAKTFTSSTGETGTFTSLVVSQQVDVRDVNSSYPRYFYQVFDANISKALAGLSVGVSDFRLEHSTTGNTNYVAVVKDDMTASPTFGSTGTLSEGTGGSKRYVSGIPYYNTGSPTVILSGVTISNLVGHAYTNQTNIVEVDPGTNAEGTSSSAIASENYTYANIDGAVSFLTGGIPNINTGTSSAYAIGNLTIDVTSSSVRTIETPQIRARNVNGVSSYSALDKKIQVHTASQTGINELVIPVSDSLGATYDDDGVRISDFLSATTDTPTFNGATNFYTNSPYTESADPGVSGTREATIRLGLLKHDTTDYSTGFLPVGPDRSGDTGTQYFTFAFRRSTFASFDISITSSTGITGMWIAAPGTAIDSASGSNGWLDTTAQYAGAGVPGSDTGNGGNGSDGCALTGADVVPTGSSLSSSYTMTLGTENGSNATGNVILVRIALASGESVSALSIGVAS